MMRRPPLWAAVADAQQAVARQQAALEGNDASACLRATADLADALARCSRALGTADPAARTAAAAALRPLRAEIHRSLTHLRVRLAWMQDWQRRVNPPAVW
jgi:hypothetical protein